jgi:hypothetical protein
MITRANAAAAGPTPATFSSRGTVRQVSYNVRDFGALGNDSHDDTAAIIAAIAALPAEGGVVFFPHGIYTITSTISIKKHGVWLIGESLISTFADQANQQAGIKGGSVIKESQSAWPSGSHGIVFGELGTNKMWTGGGVMGVVCKGTKGFITTGDGIQILNVQAVYVLNNNITGFSNGVYVRSDQAGGISNVCVEHNIMNSFNNYAVKMDSGSEMNFVRFNYISGYIGYAIYLNGIGNTVMNNHIESGTLAGSGTADGAAIFANSTYSFIYSNDMMTGCPSFGIYVRGSHSIVVGNEMTNVNGSGVANGSGIWVDGSPVDLLIDGNAINDNGGNMVYGIRDTTTSPGGVTLGINAITGYTTAPIFSTNNAFAPSIMSGNIGVGGIMSPTAWMHIAAATATKASLRMSAGVAPTSPNDGDIWYDGTNLKMRVGGTTKTFTLT